MGFSGATGLVAGSLAASCAAVSAMALAWAALLPGFAAGIFALGMAVTVGLALPGGA